MEAVWNNLKAKYPPERLHAIRDFMTKSGPGVTLEQLNGELDRQGLMRAKATGFSKNHKKLFGAKVPDLTAPKNGGVLDAPPTDVFDKLSGFVRFAAAVEAVGGIAKARTWLSVLENMMRAGR